LYNSFKPRLLFAAIGGGGVGGACHGCCQPFKKVRLGYDAAPRKAGAKAWDASQAAGRDRLLQPKGQVGPPPRQSPDARRATFRNRGSSPAQLFWEDTFFAELERGAEQQVNTFKGHVWNVKVKTKR
jgi:hypothetical protein